MRLSPSGIRDGSGIHRRVVVLVIRRRGPGRIRTPIIPHGSSRNASTRRAIRRMVVRGHLACGQGHRFGSPHLANGVKRQAGALAHVYGYAPLQIWQCKVLCAVAAIKGAQQAEQRRVLTDREKLPIAKHPAHGREIAPEHPDLPYEWVTHRFIPPAKTLSPWKSLAKYGFEIDGAIFLGHTYRREKELKVFKIGVCQPM